MIQTERLLLRSWREADRIPFFNLCQSPVVMACLGGPASLEQVDASIARVRASEERYGFCFWAIERREDEVFLGFCGFKVADVPEAPIDGEIEISWRLRQEDWGQGYAREAALASLRWAWANLTAPRVIAMTVPANRRSWGLMERIDMRRRVELDFDHPLFPDNHPLRRHIVYAADRPAGV
jgi:RimJ/RimL family protein N-acetyltransferase